MIARYRAKVVVTGVETMISGVEGCMQMSEEYILASQTPPTIVLLWVW